MDKSEESKLQDSQPPALSKRYIESLKREGMGHGLFQGFPLGNPLVGGLLLIISAIGVYSVLWGDYSPIALSAVLLVGLAIVALVVPIEWLLIMNMLAFMLADTYFNLNSLNYYYIRFVPLGMFAMRALLPSTLRKVRTYMLPGVFLKPFGLFFVMALLSATYDKFDPAGTFLRALTMGFVLVAFGVGLPAYLTDDQRLRRGLHSILVVLALSIVAGLIAIPVDSRSLFDFGDYSRARGLYSNPNTLGLMAMLSFFPILGWRMETVKGKRWPYTIILFALLMAALTSASRASFAGLLTGTIVFLLLRPLNTRNKMFLILLCIFAFALFFGLPEFWPGMLRTDTGWRFELWQRAVHLGKESPLLGSGFGSTGHVFADDRVILTRQGVYSGGAHNEYARIFVGMGGIGLFLALAGFAWVIWNAVRVIRIEKNPVIPVSLLAAVVSGLTNAVFEDWIFAFGGAPAFPFWFFLAFLAIYGHRRTLLWKNIRQWHAMQRYYASAAASQTSKARKGGGSQK